MSAPSLPDTGEHAENLGRFRRLLGRLPAWVRALIGLAAIILGAVVLLRPTTSLDTLAWLIGAGLIVLGAVELVSSTTETRRGARGRIALAAIAVIGGALVLVLPGLTVRLVAAVVAVVLLARGALLLVAIFRKSRDLDERIADAALGVASLVFGVLAFGWPDITLLVVAVAFGATLIITGVQILLALARTRRDARGHAEPGPLRRWLRTIGAVATLALAVGAGVVSGAINGGSPVVDDFYAAPRTVPDEPGSLIRSEPFTRQIPDNARAWRILYTTTDGDGEPAVASGLVVVPATGSGNWPVIDWTHGTTGQAQQCAPSLAAEPFESGAFFLLPDVIAEGWAVVATDYIGLGTTGGHAYLVGQDAGRASLDAVRAARELREARLGDETVVWGHSQGGAAALWTGAIADDYAPEVELAGVAALAPAANLPGLVASLDSVTGGSVFASYVAQGYVSAYDDVHVHDYARPGAAVIVEQMASRCLAEPGMYVSVLSLLALSQDPVVFSRDPATGPLGERLRQNVPPATMTAPLLLGQGAADSLITPQAQGDFVREWCAAGGQLDYRTYEGLDHIPLIEPGSALVPELLQWTRDRFAGESVAPGCVGAPSEN